MARHGKSRRGRGPQHPSVDPEAWKKLEAARTGKPYVPPTVEPKAEPTPAQRPRQSQPVRHDPVRPGEVAQPTPPIAPKSPPPARVMAAQNPAQPRPSGSQAPPRIDESDLW